HRHTQAHTLDIGSLIGGQLWRWPHKSPVCMFCLNQLLDRCRRIHLAPTRNGCALGAERCCSIDRTELTNCPFKQVFRTRNRSYQTEKGKQFFSSATRFVISFVWRVLLAWGDSPQLHRSCRR